MSDQQIASNSSGSALNSIIGAILKPPLKAMSRKRLPKIDGTIEIEGLIEAVEVFRDQYGRPCIYAQNDHDLYFAQGFIHAQDRLWQMELNRRAARGRLSEVFGPDALDTDRMARTFGFERLGMESLNAASDKMKNTIDAYLDGVNAFLKDPASRLPLEFSLAGFKPERYNREDCMAFVLLLSWQLSHGKFTIPITMLLFCRKE